MEKTWANGKLINGSPKVSTLNVSLNYAFPVVWEGIRAYRQLDGSCKIFKLKEHLQRLHDSAKILGFEIPFDVPRLMQACKDLVKVTEGDELYLRPIAYRDADSEGRKSKSEIKVDIYAVPAPESKDKLTSIISSYKRGYPYFQMQAKTSMNYAQLGLIEQECDRSGVDEAFITNSSGHIVEASVANVFVVKNGAILTPPDNGDILPGITRKVIIRDILTNPKIMYSKYSTSVVVKESTLTRSDLYLADEIFLTGTYYEVTPVVEVDGRKIGNGEIGLVTRIVQNEYKELTQNVIY